MSGQVDERADGGAGRACAFEVLAVVRTRAALTTGELSGACGVRRILSRNANEQPGRSIDVCRSVKRRSVNCSPRGKGEKIPYRSNEMWTTRARRARAPPRTGTPRRSDYRSQDLPSPRRARRSPHTTRARIVRTASHTSRERERVRRQFVARREKGARGERRRNAPSVAAALTVGDVVARRSSAREANAGKPWRRSARPSR